MNSNVAVSVMSRKYLELFGAAPSPTFCEYLTGGREPDSLAWLGYRRASEGPVFLESYLDAPVEIEIGKALGRRVGRAEIVEIGNFAADNAFVMLELWGAAANDLAGSSEIAVATLTAPLRRIFRRIGLPFISLCRALPERLAQRAGEWGSYYEQDPQVCAGVIADGQAAIARWHARRAPRAAA
jgi:hypothetical protein